MKKKNEVALVEEEKNLILQVAGNLVNDIEYSTLDTAIENLGNHSGKLTADEKITASELVDKFNDRVVARLRTKREKLRDFLSTLNTESSRYYDGVKDFVNNSAIEQMLQDERYPFSFAEDLYVLQQEVQLVEDYRAENKPDKPFIDEENMTPADVAKKTIEYQVKVKRWEVAVGKREFAVRKSFCEFKKKLDKNKTFKDFKKALEQQATLAKDAESVVAEKSSLAKMNILISSPDVRKILQGLHSWAKEI